MFISTAPLPHRRRKTCAICIRMEDQSDTMFRAWGTEKARNSRLFAHFGAVDGEIKTRKFGKSVAGLLVLKLPDFAENNPEFKPLSSVDVIPEMPSQPLLEDRQDDLLPASKKRRIPGACDACKRKKVRCKDSDSARRPNNRCSNCVHLSIECIHTEVGKTLGSARRYVESLEARLEKMDRLFNKLLPGVEINPELEKLDLEPPASDKQDETLPQTRPPSYPGLCRSTQLSMLNSFRGKFYGKTSNFNIIKTAIEINQGRWQSTSEPAEWLRPHYWSIPKWTGLDVNDELNLQPPSYYDYPPEDLMTSLIDLYFTHLNTLFPLLHRPIFEQSVGQELHLRNNEFGATLLLVCAHGARYSDDPRVLVDGSDSWHSAGWKWYKQMFALLNSFDAFNLMPENDWLRTGLGLRLAIDVGAHTKSDKSSIPTAEGELWKRAFWCLYLSDVRTSIALGRSSTLQDEDFDLEEPVDCDDGYWESNFQQPAGKPSRISYFKEHIKLTIIISQALYLLECITEIDTKLNKWLTSLPRHLRLGASRKNDIFELQSIYLHASFHHCQLVLHRPYIPSPLNLVPSPLPALTICFNAARACCSILSDAKKNDKKVLLITSEAFTGWSLQGHPPGFARSRLRDKWKWNDIFCSQVPAETSGVAMSLVGLSPNSQDFSTSSSPNAPSPASSSGASTCSSNVLELTTSSSLLPDYTPNPHPKGDFAMSIDTNMQESSNIFGSSSSGLTFCKDDTKILLTRHADIISPTTAGILSSMWSSNNIGIDSDSWNTFWPLPMNQGDNEGDPRLNGEMTNLF
ncbi:fungal-specific transcription factor domain-containing protein [Crepidotus variabilis]|uniref:Fungal-specific transcription factor domain-containing protein n=1 Tax=Crepidotus variabilis TaxID=179855 RepID=A0A9P6JX34_9AGAR|nr:fungal-specific transcription factor domain-containing protein [Crepidotus variabilis]